MNQRFNDAQVSKEIDDLTAELLPLITQHARHVSALHESDAAKADHAGHMRWCPGCRAILLSKRLAQLLQAMDDVTQHPHRKASRRDEIMETLAERRIREVEL